MARCYQYILCNRLVVMFPLVVSVLCWSLWSVGQSVLVKRKHSDSTHTSTQCQHKLRHNISCSSFANCENICIIFWTTINYLSVKTSLIFYPVADCSQSYVTIPSTKKKKKKIMLIQQGRKYCMKWTWAECAYHRWRFNKWSPRGGAVIQHWLV